MCKKKFQSPCVCLNNPGCLTVSVRQLGLESSIRHTQGWLKLIIFVFLCKGILIG